MNALDFVKFTKLHFIGTLSAAISPLHFRLSPTVVIDGGLGSQMIGWIKFLIAQEIWNTRKVKVDVSYYLTLDESWGAPGLTKWPWELHHYGIYLNELKPKKPLSFLRVSYEKRAKREIPLYQEISQRNWSGHFPISTLAASLRQDLGLTENYGVVHLRRGDYQAIGSKMTEVEEVVEMLGKLKSKFLENVVVISDSQISPQDFKKIEESLMDSRVQFLMGGDMHAVHGLMRESNVLITSNSTFSLSAGLTMTRGGLVVFPANFYFPEAKFLNSNLNILSKWNIL
jgi:hypothetical protein